MEEKRIQILKSAVKFFSEKGYFYTSMQDIASDCGMSKGSLYKVFDSKEDLLIQLFEYNHQQMMEWGKAVYLDDSLSGKEMLQKIIILELESAARNKDFFNIIYTSLPGEKNQRTLTLMKKTRIEMVNWHKQTLMRAYGERMAAGIWDLVVTFQGIIKEFIFLITREEKQVDLEQAATYIAEVLETLVEHLPSRPPLLHHQLMEDYESMGTAGGKITCREKQKAVLSLLRTTIEKTKMSENQKQELHSSVNMLEEELLKKEPRTFLIDALLVYLKKEKVLQAGIDQLESLLGRKGCETDKGAIKNDE